LERSDILQDLPAETLIELAHSLVRVRLEDGEPMVREGDVSEDVYILARGQMVIIAERFGSTPRGYIAPGEVFGEMAFFTGDPRSATVAATMPSECFALPGAELRLLAMARPSVLHHMGAALARRLTEVNARFAASRVEDR
jgi:CRP-like cAMP-binding protein